MTRRCRLDHHCYYRQRGHNSPWTANAAANASSTMAASHASDSPTLMNLQTPMTRKMPTTPLTTAERGQKVLSPLTLPMLMPTSVGIGVEWRRPHTAIDADTDATHQRATPSRLPPPTATAKTTRTTQRMRSQKMAAPPLMTATKNILKTTKTMTIMTLTMAIAVVDARTNGVHRHPFQRHDCHRYPNDYWHHFSCCRQQRNAPATR